MTENNLVDGIPVEEIPGLDEQKARELGLLNSSVVYEKEKAAKLAEAEAYDHKSELRNSANELVSRIRHAAIALDSLATAVNNSYGKFMLLGLEEESKNLVAIRGNIHFNAIIEALEEAKARSILLQVETLPL